MADEFLHFFEGWIIFIACAGFLIAEIFLLARLSGRTFFQVFHLPDIDRQIAAGRNPEGRPVSWRW